MKRHFVWGLIGFILSGFFGTSSISFAQTGEWTKKADMPTHREDFAAGVVNGKIYVIGGGHGGVFATVEEYDPATDTWAIKATCQRKGSFSPRVWSMTRFMSSAVG
ncbi:hypothetical protein IH992_02335 [Candidatus Poribacteria bacterium]|nr:hypothetical protein [Candidatus Poribacteria bacterium]